LVRPRRDGAIIVVTAPLKYQHVSGTEVAGTGITLTAALAHSHSDGAQVTTDVPTPGTSNNYSGHR
jgi:hypothetical protein